MNIRQLIDTDLPQLLALEEATQTEPWSEAAFKRCFEAGYPGWVIAEAEALLGFVLLSIAAGECHILNLCVAPAHQRQGLGRRLLDYALVFAKQQGAGIAYLEVRRSNQAAIGLYRMENFKQVGERQAYYPLPHGKSEDALVFARDLSVE